MRYLKYEILLRLQAQFTDRLANSVLKCRVFLPGHVQLRKQVTDKPKEDGHITGHYLWQVEIPQRSHEHLWEKITVFCTSSNLWKTQHLFSIPWIKDDSVWMT